MAMQAMTRVVLAILVIAGCDPVEQVEPDAGPDAGPVGQGSPATVDLVINEVSPRPLAGADWIELYNRSDQAVDLCGFFVTDSLDRLDHYLPLAGVLPPDPCEPTLLEPGGYLIIIADDQPALGPDHAPFKLAAADEVHVVTTAGAAVDSLVYVYPAGVRDLTLARQPSGEGLFYLAEPTPGADNPSMEAMP
jgi:hypothetical protein